MLVSRDLTFPHSVVRFHDEFLVLNYRSFQRLYVIRTLAETDYFMFCEDLSTKNQIFLV